MSAPRRRLERIERSMPVPDAADAAARRCIADAMRAACPGANPLWLALFARLPLGDVARRLCPYPAGARVAEALHAAGHAEAAQALTDYWTEVVDRGAGPVCRAWWWPMGADGRPVAAMAALVEVRDATIPLPTVAADSEAPGGGE